MPCVSFSMLDGPDGTGCNFSREWPISEPLKDVFISNNQQFENILKNVTDMLKTIPVEDFQRC